MIERTEAENIVQSLLVKSGLTNVRAKVKEYHTESNCWIVRVYKKHTKLVCGLITVNSDNGQIVSISASMKGYAANRNKEIII